MNARSALFDLYGDHLSARGGTASVAGLIRLLGALGITPPAVRTAVSRMVRQGWLAAAPTPAGPGYVLTDKARRRLDAAATRIYRTGGTEWDGHWHLLSLDPVRERSRRDRVRAGLRYLGYGPVDERVWVAARASPELDELLATESVSAETFLARHCGDTARLITRVWDLGELGAAYQAWMDDSRELLRSVGRPPTPAAAFAARTQLVHGWRKFLFVDPQLPPELLPPRWAGRRAAETFDRAAEQLLPPTAAFLDTCLDTDERRTP